MSEHPQERLSAYFDGALDGADRAEVERHLRQCAQCVVELEDLAALQSAAQALPLHAPEGYFEALPSRVRGRIRAPRRGILAKPALWTGAVAAALLLAVLTPQLLRQSPTPLPATAAPAPQLDAIAPSAASAARPPATLPPPEAPESKLKKQAEPAERGAVGAGELVAPARRPQADAQGAKAFADAPAASDEEAGRRDQGADMAQEAAPAAPEPPPPAAVGVAAGVAGGAHANAASGMAEERAERDTAGKAEMEAAPREAAKETQRQPRLAATAQAPEAPRPQPVTVQQARAERDRLRGLKADGRTKDAARLGVLEKGALAWRLGRDPEDLRQLRTDVAAYLQDASAAQASRARALLRDAERLAATER